MAWCLVTAIDLNEQAKTKHNNKIQYDMNKPDVTGELYEYEMFSCGLVHPCQLSPELQSECCALYIPVCSQEQLRVGLQLHSGSVTLDDIDVSLELNAAAWILVPFYRGRIETEIF
jgi:hypothetical protein